MCGRTASNLSRDDLAAMMEVDPDDIEAPELAPSWDIAPSQKLYAVQLSPAGQRQLVAMRWGLVPSWAKPPIKGGLINARAETVMEKPAFRDAVAYGRVLLPVSGFYEWDRRAPGRPTPYYFRRADSAPMVFAGISQTWVGPDGFSVTTCAVLTTAANELMAPVHDRIPVVLGPGQWAEWLERKPLGRDRLEDLTSPVPAGVLEAYPVAASGPAGGPDLSGPPVDTHALPASIGTDQLTLGLFG